MENKVTIQVLIGDANRKENFSFQPKSLAIPKPQALTSKNESARKQSWFRNSIEQLDGLERKVFIDLYRYEVESNFAQFESMRGKKGLAAMTLAYPENNTLPFSSVRTKDTNGLGAIVLQLMHFDTPESETYKILAGILQESLNEDVFPKSKRLPQIMSEDWSESK